MDAYIDLLKLFKVGANNVQILHRHLAGENWFSNHLKLGEYYDKLQEDLDKYAEIGLSIEIDEPTMQQSLDTYKEIEIKNRNINDSYLIVKQLFNDIVAQINRIENIPKDVISELEETQNYYRVESDYKLFRATMNDIER